MESKSTFIFGIILGMILGGYIMFNAYHSICVISEDTAKFCVVMQLSVKDCVALVEKEYGELSDVDDR